MDFETFLKNLNKKEYVFYSFFKDSNYFIEQMKKGVKPDRVIPRSDLGEWAWQRGFVKNNKRKKYYLKDDSYYVYREIAIACLGKPEIQKRLTKLQEIEKK